MSEGQLVRRRRVITTRQIIVHIAGRVEILEAETLVGPVLDLIEKSGGVILSVSVEDNEETRDLLSSIRLGYSPIRVRALNTRTVDLGLSGRITRALISEARGQTPLNRVWQILEQTEEELLGREGVGPRTLERLRKVLYEGAAGPDRVFPGGFKLASRTLIDQLRHVLEVG